MSIIGKLLDLCNLDRITEKNVSSKSAKTVKKTTTKKDVSAPIEIKHKPLSVGTPPAVKSEPIPVETPAVVQHEPLPVETSVDTEYIDSFVEDEDINSCGPYISSRFTIKGLDLYFIPVAREIVRTNTISKIPLMHEYNISSDKLDNILTDMINAQIIDNQNNILMTSEELEKFIDIYEPSLFDCTHTTFDKDIFMCIGEIIYSNGFEDVYSSMAPDDVVDYLRIMEKLNLIKYDSFNNSFSIEVEKSIFLDVCDHIPNSFSKSENQVATKQDYNIMTGPEFENFCANLLTQNGFINVTLTPNTGDHGIDILAEKDEITYAIQCKCYSSNVGNAAVQQAHTGKCLYKKDIGVILTNQHFTQQAIDEANLLGIKLWDKEKLEFLIKNINA